MVALTANSTYNIMMKRLIIFLLALATTTSVAYAAPAHRLPYTVSQPDGSLLTVTLNGDEHLSWYTADDGTILFKNPDAYYVATISDNGELVASSLPAHNATLRNVEEQQACQQQRQRIGLFEKRVTNITEKARQAQVRNTTYFPHVGSPKCLVILAQFSDVKFASSDPHAQFTQYFNGEIQEDLGHNEQRNLVSVKKYFEQSSNGLFSPHFDIVGPVTLSNTQKYYGKDDKDHDTNFNQFCNDAISAVDKEVDFHDYDNNGDGNAELVCIIYAGYGQNVSGNPDDAIWGKCSYQNLSTADGIKVTYCNCGAELRKVSAGNDINGIGVMVHEFSHGLGLPDLYATVTSAQINNQSPEFWDLMDYGEYGDNGYSPVPYTAWEREAMGWLEIEELKESQTGVTLDPLNKGGKAYKFGNGANSEEFIHLQNVQARDAGDKTLGYFYGHGLLVMHVAYKKSDVTMLDYPNNTAQQPGISIVPADGLVINGYLFGDNKPYTQTEYLQSLRGDPFPGTSAATTLSAKQDLPNYQFYNGETTPPFVLENIVENPTTGVITFDFKTDSHDGVDVTLRDFPSTTDDAYYTLDGRCLKGSPTRQGLYLHNGKKIVMQ